MTPKLKLSAVPDERPVKVTVELPAAVFKDLQAYADAIGCESGHDAPDPVKLISPMLQRFMATDKGFRKVKGQLKAADR
jgi:hypothetical protein